MHFENTDECLTSLSAPSLYSVPRQEQSSERDRADRVGSAVGRWVMASETVIPLSIHLLLRHLLLRINFGQVLQKLDLESREQKARTGRTAKE